ncbi:MAG: WYL domain-containing protein, partial [Dehalococcoidales bacterium]|nr:WYL domain-containing protein [Dehalococcoidales bacterium]
MKDKDSLARAIRLSQIQHFLHSDPSGLTSKELADLCGVCVRTIQRDILSLDTDLKVPLMQNGDRYGITEGYILPPVSFSLYEAMVIFLACRLALRQTDENNPHIERALTKISSVLPSTLAIRLKESASSVGDKKEDLEFIRNFENIAIAWTTQRQVKMKYQSLESEGAKEWRLEPYFVDMTGVGFSVYVIGHAVRVGKEGMITFKLERMKDVEVLNKRFEIPPDINIGKLLEPSWGIFTGDAIGIILKFSPHVTRRVKESVWHISQSIEDTPDGGCLL